MAAESLVSLQAAGTVISTILDVKKHLDLVAELKRNVNAIPRLRSNFHDLDDFLRSVENTYRFALSSYAAPIDEVRRFNRLIENVRRPSEEINEILITVLRVRTTFGKSLKLSDSSMRLENLRLQIQDAKTDLALAMATISEQRSQYRDSWSDVSSTTGSALGLPQFLPAPTHAPPPPTYEPRGLFHDWLDHIGGP